MRHGGFVGLRSFDPTVHQGTSNNTLLRLSERCGARAKVGPRSGTVLTPPVVRATTRDDAFVIRRKRARGYVYSGPSTTVIKKKRYVHYREPSHAVIIKKRWPAIAVEGGSTRTTVRSQTSTTVRDSGTTRENVRAGASVRERSTGAGNAGARAGGRSGQDGQPATSGRSGGGGTSQNLGTSNAPGSR